MGQQITDSKTRRGLVGAGGRKPAPAVAAEEAEARKRVGDSCGGHPSTPRHRNPSLLSVTSASSSSYGATRPQPHHHHLQHLLTRRQRPAFPLSLYTSLHLVLCSLFSCLLAVRSSWHDSTTASSAWLAPLTSAGNSSTASQSLMSVSVARMSQWAQLMQPFRESS
ncbi:hypothetical protein BHE74_00019516 [Ensete ventricosum]|nr:hypothetical protein BHE74_00019516 [Ensete ventricosum]RZR80044.1 hypothetical protein BHM03_00005946 [Ensete ventricosum]